MKRVATSSLAAAIALLGCSTSLWAGGLDIPTVSAANQGTSNANSAEARDASVIFYNPAGMARLKGVNMTGSLSVFGVRGKVEVDRQNTTNTPAPGELNGRPIGDCNQDPNNCDPQAQGGPGSFWPALLASPGLFVSTPLHRLNFPWLMNLPYAEDMTIGIGIFAPGGGNLNYKSDWGGRYFADNVAIELSSSNTAFAIRFDDKHSIGWSTNLLLGHLRQGLQIDNGVAPYLLQPAIDDFNAGSATSLVNGVLANLPASDPLRGALQDVSDQLSALNGSILPPALKDQLGTALSPVLLSPESNSRARIEMFGYGLGFSLGYLYEFNENQRLSLAFHSHSRMKFRGKLDWQVEGLSSPLDPIGIPGPDGERSYPIDEFLQRYYRPDATVKSELIVPARFSVGYFHKLNNKIDAMFDYTFIRTSDVQSIRVDILGQRTENVDNVVQGPGSIITKWRDSFKASVGLNYHYSDNLMLRTGFQ